MGTHLIPREIDGDARILLFFTPKGFLGILKELWRKIDQNNRSNRIPDQSLGKFDLYRILT